MVGFLKIVDRDARRSDAQAAFVTRLSSVAQDFVRAAVPPGAGFDYSLFSVQALDDALEAVYLGTLRLTPMQTIGAAAYLYEVARRAYGGRYEVCDDEDPVVLICGRPQSRVCFGAIAKVERRIRYGASESISRYFDRFIAALWAGQARTIR